MQVKAAIVTVNSVVLAVVLVDIDTTYPTPGDAMLRQAQRFFPALPILLISPRIDGFSRAYAAFDFGKILARINTNSITWGVYNLPEDVEEPPF